MGATEATAGRAERLLQLKLRFLDDAVADVRELLRLLDGSVLGSADGAAERFRKLAHDLRGTGGSYGFDAITDAAAALEDEFLADQPSERLRDTTERLERVVAEAHAVLRAASAESRPSGEESA